ncbi:hypothetical protein [Helicobacter trogontum]|uniref:Uncharacterized protein n=1 Tax=Helicobacter trogontum TaxID=50960 RepID=A0A4U8SDX0_9HELI|nr:hypothetical protein [Helicobacter trogontum]TLD84247.1 hypothetical protein LS81_001925 [Helicobacter trogontum]
MKYDLGINALINPAMAVGGTTPFTGMASKAGNVANPINKTTGAMSKFTKGLDAANQFIAPIQAAGSAVGLGFDIYNTIESQKKAQEQLDLAKKNFNLELEKDQKQELAYNQLAASIDRAWGGDGKVENTIDYSQYKVDNDKGGASLVNSGAGAGEVMGPSSTSTQAVSSNELSGSGNTPIMSAGTITPVGYSESLTSNNNEATQQNETS